MNAPGVSTHGRRIDGPVRRGVDVPAEQGHRPAVAPNTVGKRITGLDEPVEKGEVARALGHSIANAKHFGVGRAIRAEFAAGKASAQTSYRNAKRGLPPNFLNSSRRAGAEASNRSLGIHKAMTVIPASQVSPGGATGRRMLRGAGEVAAQHQWSGALKAVPTAAKPAIRVMAKRDVPTGSLVIRQMSPEERQKHQRRVTTVNAVAGGVTGGLIGGMIPGHGTGPTMEAARRMARMKLGRNIGIGTAVGAVAQGALGHHAGKKAKYTLDVEKFVSAETREKDAAEGYANKDKSWPIRTRHQALAARKLALSGHGKPGERADALRRADALLRTGKPEKVGKRDYDPEANRQRRQGVYAGALGAGGTTLAAHGLKRGSGAIRVESRKRTVQQEERKATFLRPGRKAGTRKVTTRTLKVPFKRGAQLGAGAAMLGGAGMTLKHMNSRSNDPWR